LAQGEAFSNPWLLLYTPVAMLSGSVPQQFIGHPIHAVGAHPGPVGSFQLGNPGPVGSFQVGNPGPVGSFQAAGEYVVGGNSQNLQQVGGTHRFPVMPAVGPLGGFPAGPVGSFQASRAPQFEPGMQQMVQGTPQQYIIPQKQGSQFAPGAQQIVQGAPQQYTVSQKQSPGPSADNPNEAWLSKDAAMRRRAEFGIDDLTKFIESCEFVSLGNFCGVARALQALDFKKYAYPFDWVRSPTFGVLHCLETDFEDFLTYTVARDEGPKGHLFGSTNWGGSFWHHNIVKPETKDSFVRRIERLYGYGEVPPEKPRVFVRALNSTRELDDCVRLHQALRRALPSARSVYLLVLLDMQSDLTPARLHDHDITLLFCKVHESLFADNGTNWSMEKQGVAYAEQIAFAIRVWNGDPRAKSQIKEFSDMHALAHACDGFDGGSCAIELFFPRKFQGQMITINPHRQAQATRSSWRDAESPRASSGGASGLGIMRRLKDLQAQLQCGVDGDDDDDSGELYFTDAQERGRQQEMIPAPIEQEMRYRPPSRSLSRSISQERNLPSQGRIHASSVPAPVQGELGWIPDPTFRSRECSPEYRYAQLH